GGHRRAGSRTRLAPARWRRESRRSAGAIVDRRQTAGILAAIERAQGEGATLLGGGRQLTINGSDNFIEPTLFG
ncbi:aldehyde dehydrogenase family protein, partial [Pseudomonas aeruginosa]